MPVQISPEIESQYEEAARRFGESKDDLMRDALLSYLEDLHDLAIAKERLANPGERISFEQVKKNLGLDD